MSRLLIPLALILLTAPAIAQRTPVEVKAPDGRTVILKPDGTWEFKKDAPPPSPKTTTSTNSATPETLSPNFSGDDTTTLLRQLADLRKRLMKSEFETSAAYEQRVAEEKKKPILGDRSVEDSFYLVSSAVKAEYNADTQIIVFTLPVERNAIAEMRRGRQMPESRNTDLSWVSLYAVSLGSYDDPKVFFDQTNGLPLSGDRYNQHFAARVTLSVEDARRVKTGTRALLVVRFEDPYAITSLLTGGQFQARLLDIQFFDQQTGRVLTKLGSTVVPSSGSTTPAKKNPHLEKAQGLYNARRDDEALVELRLALVDEPTNAEAFLLTGRIKLQAGDQEASIAALKTALFWDSQLIDAHILLGRVFLARRDLAEARKHVASALALDPNNAEAHALQRQVSR